MGGVGVRRGMGVSRVLPVLCASLAYNQMYQYVRRGIGEGGGQRGISTRVSKEEEEEEARDPTPPPTHTLQ